MIHFGPGRRCYRWLVVWLLVLLYWSPAQASSSPARSTTSPIANWGPSWAASAAQGTVLTLSCREDNECDDDDDETKHEVSSILLILQRPKRQHQSSSPPKQSITDSIVSKTNDMNITKLDNTVPNSTSTLRLLPYPTDSYSRWYVPPMMTLLLKESSDTAAAVCCLTGLVSDVEYLSRGLAQVAEAHRHVYQDDSVSDATQHAIMTTTNDHHLSQPLSLPSLVHLFARRLREATHWQGGRPYGIQALMIGQLLDSTTLSNSAMNHRYCRSAKLHVFTLDPSGGHRHWGSSATAIGRGASLVRSFLTENALAKSKPAETPVDRLRIALEAMMRATASIANNNKSVQDVDLLRVQTTHEFEGLLIRQKSPSLLSIFTIDPQQLEEIQHGICQTANSISSLVDQ